MTTYVGSFRTVSAVLRGQDENCQVPDPLPFFSVGMQSVPTFRRASYPAFGNASTSDAIIKLGAVWLPSSHADTIRRPLNTLIDCWWK
jgi:hypothetical protein